MNMRLGNRPGRKRTGGSHVCIVLSLVVLLFGGVATSVAAADGTPNARRLRATNSATTRRIAEAERRAEAAEQRAQAAEEAAAQAQADARAAQEQAARAADAARQANEALVQVQASVARLEKSDAESRTEIASIKQTDARLTTDLASAKESADKGIASLDQKTAGVVTSESKRPVTFYGSLLLSTNYVDGGSNNADIPLFALKNGSTLDQNHQNYNMTVRQTRFGFKFDGPTVANAKLSGQLEFDMFGGKPAFPNGMDFDLLRVRLAFARLDWKNDSLEAGQDWAVFQPLNPTTLASYAIPGFAGSGNLWYRLPQIRYEHRSSIGDQGKFIVQAAALDPNAGDNSGNPGFRLLGLGERGSMPAIETRMAFALPAFKKTTTIGVSGHYQRQLAELDAPAGSLKPAGIDSYGVGVDANVWLSSFARVSGEAFHGRALGIFSGQVIQSGVVMNGRAEGINSTGGWGEVHIEAPADVTSRWKNLSANAGYGIEQNDDQDLLTGMRERNQTFMVNGQYKLYPNVTLALEYRHVRTDYFRQDAADNSLNWANLSILYTF